MIKLTGSVTVEDLGNEVLWGWRYFRKTGWRDAEKGKEYIGILESPVVDNSWIRVDVKFMTNKPTMVLREACREPRTHAALMRFFKDWQ